MPVFHFHRCRPAKHFQYHRHHPATLVHRFHLALDDGLLQVFARDWLVPLMKNLGLTDDRCIESGMLTRRIRAAQKEFPSRTNPDPVAASSHEWIERHDAQPK